MLFLFDCYATHRHLHSFPTRRSSDLIRNASALIDISPLFKYRLAGKDATRLVDRVITRDMRKVSVGQDRKSTRVNSSHLGISYAVFCLKKKKKLNKRQPPRER